MRLWLALGSVSALVTVAACNRAEEAPAPQNEATSASNEAAPATAAPTDVAAIMERRHENYEDIGDAMKAIGAELKGSAPSVETIQRQSAVIAGFAPQVPSWFPAGSGPETGRETRAKAEIWSDPETFAQRVQAFQAEAARFDAAARSGDLEAIRAAVGPLGNSCKNCHDRFRAPED